MKKLFFVGLTNLILVLLAAPALASPSCRFVFDSRYHQLIEKDTFEQWLIWEQESNFSLFRKSRAPIAVAFTDIPREEVNVSYLNSASPALKNLIDHGDQVRWFLHPYNRVRTLPYFENEKDGSLQVWFTASRSLAIKLENEYYTLKMPTDHPHGPKGEYQPEKATTEEDIKDAKNRMAYIERVDSEIGEDPVLVLAKEVAMVEEKVSGEGYLFRDLSFMKPGHFYLPALSIPYAGRGIAYYNGQNPEIFWNTAYAAILGQAKAKLLLRYGLQMETPNAQNMLIELDTDLRPTGRIVFRDISDTMLIKGVAKGLGEEEVLINDRTMRVENTTVLKPFWVNSAWRFDEAGDLSFSRRTLGSWSQTHNQAYRREIEENLDLDLSPFQKIDDNPRFNAFMSSELVQKKLQNYRKRLKAKHRASRNQKAG